MLNYLKYTKKIGPNAHMHVFKQAIKVNDVTQMGTKIAYFQWMLQDMMSTWGDTIVNSHLDCTFNEFAQAFCKSTARLKQMSKCT
jgi:hypothetical protein